MKFLKRTAAPETVEEIAAYLIGECAYTESAAWDAARMRVARAAREAT